MAVDNNYADAQVRLAEYYYKGNEYVGIEQDYSEAFKWWQKVAEQSNIYAQDALASMYEKGEGVGKDCVEAAKWYLKAVEQGSGDSFSKLANLCEEDNFAILDDLASVFISDNKVEREFNKVMYMAKESVDDGNAEAMFRLACLYRDGKGVDADKQKAKELFNRAVELGYKSAETNLSIMEARENAEALGDALENYKKHQENRDAIISVIQDVLDDTRDSIAAYIAERADAVYYGSTSSVVHSGWINSEIRWNAKIKIVNKSKDYDICNVDDIVAIIDYGVFSNVGKTGVVFTVEGVYLPITNLKNKVEKSLFFRYDSINYRRVTTSKSSNVYIYLINNYEPIKYFDSGSKKRLSRLINDILEFIRSQ